MRFLYSTLFRAACMAAFVAVSSVGLAAGADTKKPNGPELGLQTWTCRFMKFDEVVAFAVKHKIKYLQLIKDHMDPNAPAEETLRKKAILDQHGLVPYTFGVAATSLKKEENRKLFEFAKLIGTKLIIVEPRDQAIWDNLEELVKEYDIKLAIHNHGKGSVYGDPATIKEILAKRDRRIGVCMDVGWVTAAEFDAAKVFREYGPERVFDMHFKDKTVTTGADGKPVITDVEVGKGQANYAGLFEEIRKSKWSGVLAIETDNRGFQQDPNTLVNEAKAFFAKHTGKK